MDRKCRWSRLCVSLPPGFVTVVLCLVSIAGAARLCAQVENGIAGTVTDSSGAAVANAAVTVVNGSTGVSVHTATTSVGKYKVIGLEPGHYSVEVQAEGFSKSVHTNVIVEVAKTSTAD